MLQPVTQRQIIFAGIAPDIQNQNYQGKTLSLPQIGFNHIPPVFFHRLRNLGKTITGKINKRQLFIERKKIDQLRPPRRIAGLGQSFTPDQRIDQRWFTHVGTPHESYFRQRRRRILRRPNRTLNKFCTNYFHNLIPWSFPRRRESSFLFKLSQE